MEPFQKIIVGHCLDPFLVSAQPYGKDPSHFTYLDANPAIGLIVLISNGAPSRFSSARSLPKAWK